MDLRQLVEVSAIIVFFIGFYGLITSKNIIKSIASIGLTDMATVVFLLSIGYAEGIKPPIRSDVSGALHFAGLTGNVNAAEAINAAGTASMAYIADAAKKAGEADISIVSDLAHIADPLPQSLVITAIIVGVAATAVNLTMLISLGRQCNTVDWDEVRKINAGLAE
jgi:multisubunit Na+/H+ antiporter MnhC subunit